MKKIIAIALTLALAFAVTGCGDENDNNTSSVSTSSQVQVSSDVTSEPEVSVPVTSEPETSSESEPEEKEWEASDFEVYGLSDISKPDFGSETAHYWATSKGGIIAMWEGVTDMDKITEYGKSVFALTEAKGGNYNTEYNPDALKWVLNEKYDSFDNACTAWTQEYYYSDW